MLGLAACGGSTSEQAATPQEEAGATPTSSRAAATFEECNLISLETIESVLGSSIDSEEGEARGRRLTCSYALSSGSSFEYQVESTTTAQHAALTFDNTRSLRGDAAVDVEGSWDEGYWVAEESVLTFHSDRFIANLTASDASQDALVELAAELQTNLP